MPAPKPSSLSDAELEVLKVLWNEGPATVREVKGALRQQGRSWAHTTVLTLLQRLESKGFAASDKSGMAHVFRAAMTRDKLLRERLSHLAAELCEGTATPLVRALVEGHRFTTEEIEHFRQLIDRLDPQHETKRSGQT
jgi:BlaI family penicillinase repressor